MTVAVSTVVTEMLKLTEGVKDGFGLDDPDIVGKTDAVSTVVTEMLKLTEGVNDGLGLADADRTEAGEGVVV
jgi:hypothetical protein